MEGEERGGDSRAGGGGGSICVGRRRERGTGERPDEGDERISMGEGVSMGEREKGADA